MKPEHREEYERLHADVWPEVLSQIKKSNIRNYSIYRYGETLFSYFDPINSARINSSQANEAVIYIILMQPQTVVIVSP